jgi:beta-glucanase (GH16 family)
VIRGHINLSKNGTGGCTANTNAQYYAEACTRNANTSSHTILNPVRSARLTTQGKKSIRYGRVEVVAKVPKGDWLWPAIWMMPEDSEYGIWPLSGEIDIMESRGNARGYRTGGRETVSSTIHWGKRRLGPKL